MHADHRGNFRSEVHNPRAEVMSEDIMLQAGWFWWPWVPPCSCQADSGVVLAGRKAPPVRIGTVSWVSYWAAMSMSGT
jgi:hypothetical protein